jgi:hypothetical protein
LPFDAEFCSANNGFRPIARPAGPERRINPNFIREDGFPYGNCAGAQGDDTLTVRQIAPVGNVVISRGELGD